MKKYVAGFLFRRLAGQDEVALIRKNKPAWQYGMLNGVGGKIENEETPLAAMVREFEEETGARVDAWTSFCTLYVPEAQIIFFRSRVGNGVGIGSTTDEEVAWYPVLRLPEVIPNLRWLIPMALDDTAPIAIVNSR